MRCEETRKSLEAYYEGDLSVECRDAVRGHLAECESCRLEAAVYEQVERALAARPVLRAPDAAVRRVTAQVSVLAGERRGREARSAGLAAGLVATVAALGRWAAANRVRAAMAACAVAAAAALGVLEARGAFGASAEGPVARAASGYAAKASAWLGAAARDATSAAHAQMRASMSWSDYDSAAYAFNVSIYAAIAVAVIIAVILLREDRILARRVEQTYRMWSMR